MDESRNFQSIMWATNELLSSNKNPRTGRPYSDLEKLKKGADIFRNSDPNKDYRPVGATEAAIIFNDYYDEKYGPKKSKRHKVKDASLLRANALKPKSVESFMFRPIRDAKGKLIKSGPEKYDFVHVDDSTQNEF